VPDVRLPSTLGGEVSLAEAAAGFVVVYVYPRTGTPGQALPEGWDEIPGARGCTPENCSFRDHQADIAAFGAAVLGVSSMEVDAQAAFAERERIPYPLLNDAGLQLAERLGLPTFEAAGMTLYKRLTFIACAGRIARVFYPVFPPDRNAADVLDWLSA
jgi:peroxiredoxin